MTDTHTSMIEDAITEHYGQRCEETEPGCPSCDAWGQFDALSQQVEDTARTCAEQAEEIQRLRRQLAEARNAALDEAAKPSPLADLLARAVERAEKAMLKFPQPNYVISKFAEESGEVTKALIHAAEGRETWANVEDEIVDTLAMLHRLFVEGDEVHGLPSLLFLSQEGQSDE